RSVGDREAILAAPGFGQHFTDHMVTLPYVDGAWGTPTVEAYAPLTIDPSAVVLHYAQTIFEGLKATVRPTARSPPSARRRTRPGSTGPRDAWRCRRCPRISSWNRSGRSSRSTVTGFPPPAVRTPSTCGRS